MAASASSPHLASPHISISSRPAAAGTGRDPLLGLSAAPAGAVSVRVRSWRRFAGARCEVALVPVVRPRRICAQPRRRNALREKKASPPWPDEPQRQLDLDSELGISGGLDAVRIGNVVSEWDLDGGSDLVRVAETGPGIVGMGGNAEVEGHDGNLEEVMISRSRAMAGEFGSGECEIPKDGSLFRFLTVEAKEPLVVGAEFSAVQIYKPGLRGIAWSGFATLCVACIVLVVSKLIWGDGKKYLPRNMFGICKLGINEGELDKGGIKVLRNVKFPEDLLGRPWLDRRKLMNNIKRAKQSRDLFALSNVFGHYIVANCYGAIITEIRRMVANVHMSLKGILEQNKTKRQNPVLFPHPIVTNSQEISASHGQVSLYLGDELDSTEVPDISISNNIIEESVESPLDFKNSAQVMDNSVNNQNNVGDTELPKTTLISDMMTDSKNSTPTIHMAEIEQVAPSDEYNVGVNSVSTSSSEFERKRQLPDIGVKNLDGIFGIKSSSQINTGRQMIVTNDNSHELSIDVVSKTADDLSSGYSNATPSEPKSKEIPLDINGSDLNYFEEIGALRNAGNDTQTVHYEEFSHIINIGKEACINPAMADILTNKSPQKISEEHVDIMRDNVQSIQELEPSSSVKDGKHIVHANQENNKISRGHNETQASSETDSTGTIDNASTSSVYALTEESTHQNVKNSTKYYEKGFEESIIKRKIKSHQVLCNDKDAQTKHKLESVSGIGTVVGPSNGVCKTERVAKKLSKKMPCDKGVKVPAQDNVQSNSMVDKKSSSQNVKRARKNLKGALHNQAQTRQEISETAFMVVSPDDAPRAENIKPFSGSGSSAEIQSPMFSDTFCESQPNRFSVGTMRKEKSKHNFQALESMEAAAVKIKTNKHSDNAMDERAIDFDISKLGVTTTKKMKTRRSLSKRRKSTNGLGGATDVPPDV